MSVDVVLRGLGKGLLIVYKTLCNFAVFNGNFCYDLFVFNGVLHGHFRRKGTALQIILSATNVKITNCDGFVSSLVIPRNFSNQHSIL